MPATDHRINAYEYRCRRTKWEGQWDAERAREILDSPEDDLDILIEDEAPAGPAPRTTPAGA